MDPSRDVSPLDSYVKGKIVLIGDAVRQFLDTDLGYF